MHSQYSTSSGKTFLWIVYLWSNQSLYAVLYSPTAFFLQSLFAMHFCLGISDALSTFVSPLISFSDTWQRPRLGPLIQFGGWRVSLNKQTEDEALSAYVSEITPYVNRRLIWQRGRYLHRRHELRLPLQCVHSTQAAETLFNVEFIGGR